MYLSHPGLLIFSFVCPVSFHPSSLGTGICGTAVINISADFAPFVFAWHPCLRNCCPPQRLCQQHLPIIPVLSPSPHLYLERLPLSQLLAKLQCLDATPRSRLCPSLVILLVPCKLVFRLMVCAVLLSFCLELMWIFRPWSTKAASPSKSTCNAQGP